eukprot:4486912-Amphidinium_carterae.1
MKNCAQFYNFMATSEQCHPDSLLCDVILRVVPTAEQSKMLETPKVLTFWGRLWWAVKGQKVRKLYE